MGSTIQKLLNDLPKDRREKIKAKADSYIREYESLSGLRKDLGITQEEIAQIQGVKQVNISNLEKRNDMLISTLDKYIAALGGKLEIHVRFPGASVASIKGLMTKPNKSKPTAVRQGVAAKKARI